MDPKTVRARLKALVAGIIIAVLVIGLVNTRIPSQTDGAGKADYGYVYSGAKAEAVDFVRANLTDSSILVFGSSEFSTPADTVPQVPSQVFGLHNYGVKPMLLGEAFDQALWAAIALGAYASTPIPRNRVVLIVGPGQYTDGGLDNATFKERFSRPLYARFCQNEKIPDGVKSYVRNRLRHQGIDEATIRAGAAEDPISMLNMVLYDFVDDLRIRRDLVEVREKGMEFPTEPYALPNWQSLMYEAYQTGKEKGADNEWGLDDTFYNKQLKPQLAALKDSRSEETYTDTMEYVDLKCFLDVADFCGLESLVVIEPVCGPYYDHIGISKEVREGCYQKIRDEVANHPSARIADFSDREYEPYFLFDIVHFGCTGWVSAELSIYEFAEGGI